MRITEWIDSYEIRARIFPTIIVFFPFVILVRLIIPVIYTDTFIDQDGIN